MDSIRIDHQTAPDVSYDSVSNHEFALDLTVGWKHLFQVQGINVEVVVEPGIRQVLGNGGLTDTLRSGTNGVSKIENDFDQTMFLGHAALQIAEGNLLSSVGILGEYGNDSQSTALYGELKFQF